jgi:hypothetical protein
LISPSLGDLLSFCLAQKESKQRKKAPCIIVDGKKRHRSLPRFTSNGAGKTRLRLKQFPA